MASSFPMEGETPSTSLLDVFAILTDPHQYVPETRRPIQGLLQFLDTKSIGNLLQTCTTLAMDIGNSLVLQHPSHANYIWLMSMVQRRIFVGGQECGYEFRERFEYWEEESDSFFSVSSEGTSEHFFADGDSVSVRSNYDHDHDHDHDHNHQSYLAPFIGCNRCGCSNRMDEVGDRICWCESCRNGCFYIRDYCFNCSCVEEYDAYSGEKLCYCEPCQQSGCVHKVFKPLSFGKEFT